MKTHRKNGRFTTYAMDCGAMEAQPVDNDPQAITLGTESCCFVVKSRVHGSEPVQLRFPKTSAGYTSAIGWYRRLIRSALPQRQGKPAYSESNPKIDLYILTNGGGMKYYGSTNYWRTCRDALSYYNKQGSLAFVHAARGEKE